MYSAIHLLQPSLLYLCRRNSFLAHAKYGSNHSKHPIIPVHAKVSAYVECEKYPIPVAFAKLLYPIPKIGFSENTSNATLYKSVRVLVPLASVSNRSLSKADVLINSVDI